MNLQTAPCRHCGEPIVWVMSDNDRPMPIDTRPDRAGNVYVTRVRGKLHGHVRHKNEPRPRGVPFQAHFSTCQVLNRGRKRKETTPCEPKPEPLTLFDGA